MTLAPHSFHLCAETFSDARFNVPSNSFAGGFWRDIPRPQMITTTPPEPFFFVVKFNVVQSTLRHARHVSVNSLKPVVKWNGIPAILLKQSLGPRPPTRIALWICNRPKILFFSAWKRTGAYAQSSFLIFVFPLLHCCVVIIMPVTADELHLQGWTAGVKNEIHEWL